MKGLSLFLIMLAGVVLSVFLVNNLNSYAAEESNSVLHFRSYTSAVCTKVNNSFTCEDRYFVDCNGEVTSRISECNGFKIDNKVFGFATFDENWVDPRV